MGKEDRNKGLDGLLEIISHLRGPDGCPWDKKQTKEDLKGYLIDEAYEVVDAIDKGSQEELKEELGDLLFQILFLSHMAEERGEFTIKDVIQTISEKMIRRHPHVFGGMKVTEMEEVRTNWKRIKESEGKGYHKSILPEMPGSIPALYRAYKISNRLSKKGGFNQESMDAIFQRADEKWRELKECVSKEPERLRIEEELGDFIFTIVNLGRALKVDCEKALRKATERFIRSFRLIEES